MERSGFKKQINFPLAFLTPKLFAEEKPKLILFSINKTSGNKDLIILIESSLELLSTTIISDFMFFAASLRLLKHNSKKNLEL